MTDVQLIDRGLARLYRYRRMLELNAPLPLLANAKKLMMEVKDELGPRWDEIEQDYRVYAKIRNEENEQEKTWETRCHDCVHWKGPPWEWQDEGVDIQKVKWCEQFKLDEIHRPDKCPEFSDNTTKSA